MNSISHWTELVIASLKAMGENLMGALPNILGAIILLIMGWVIAKVVSKVIARLLKGPRVEKWTQKINGSESMQENGMSIAPAKVISQFVYWLILLVFFITASDTLGWQSVSTEVGGLLRYLPKLLSAIIIFVIGMYIANFIKQAILATFISLGVSGAKLISTIAFYVIIVILTVTAMNQAGIDTEILTHNITLILGSVLFAFALAFGLGARDILQNILSGLYSRKSFNPGEKVRLEGIEGVIEAIDSVNVTLKTSEGKIVIPAKDFISSKVEIIQ